MLGPNIEVYRNRELDTELRIYPGAAPRAWWTLDKASTLGGCKECCGRTCSGRLGPDSGGDEFALMPFHEHSSL